MARAAPAEEDHDGVVDHRRCLSSSCESGAPPWVAALSRDGGGGGDPLLIAPVSATGTWPSSGSLLRSKSIEKIRGDVVGGGPARDGR